jgi:hypothetical protein
MTRPALLLTSCCLVAGLLFTGCATTAPATYRSPPAVTQMAPAPEKVQIAPIDIELSELTASGALERHEEWTQTAQSTLLSAIQQRTNFRPHLLSAASNPELAHELSDVSALVHVMSVNQLNPRIVGPPMNTVPPSALAQTFDYQTGALATHANEFGDGAILIIYLRDSYSTGGRKALAALSLVGAAFTGVYIAPAMGSTVAMATLVNHDGQVIWMNQTTLAPDLRKEEGINALLDILLQGLPSEPADQA